MNVLAYMCVCIGWGDRGQGGVRLWVLGLEGCVGLGQSEVVVGWMTGWGERWVTVRLWWDVDGRGVST